MELLEGLEWMNLAATGDIKMPFHHQEFLRRKVLLLIPDIGDQLVFFVRERPLVRLAKHIFNDNGIGVCIVSNISASLECSFDETKYIIRELPDDFLDILRMS